MSSTVETLGIIGAGTMGAGIMINAVTHGVPVILVDRADATLEAARSKLDRYLARQVDKGRMSTQESAESAARLALSVNLAALAPCDLVIEAVFENLELKRGIFTALEQIVSPKALLASNTSCLRIGDISEVLARPGRFLGLHYFSPAEINPVVEVISATQTDEVTHTAALAFVTMTGKTAIPCQDQNGFALNRFFCPYTNEASRLLEEGVASAAQIDAVAQEVFGVALGPFAVMNIVGTATNLNAVRNLEPLGDFYKAAGALVERGAKNLPWDIDDNVSALPAEVHRLVSERLMTAVLLPIQELLAEGVAPLNSLDEGARLAFRFERLPSALLRDWSREI